MVVYHFTRADYMKDAFYAVMVGLAFAALIILYTLIKMIVQIHKSRSTGKLDLIPLSSPWLSLSSQWLEISLVQPGQPYNIADFSRSNQRRIPLF